MPRSRVVALAFQTAISRNQLKMRGIMDYARQHGNWRFAFSPEEVSPLSLSNLAGWDGDGVLGRVEVPEHRRVAHKLRCPLVNLSAMLRNTGLPTVISDDAFIGQLAAEHLLEHGFRRFAYYGPQTAWYSEERCRGFTERVAAAGCSCEVFVSLSGPRSGRPWVWDSSELADWMCGLRCPVGLLAAHDNRARMALETCLLIGRRVPQDIAIVGADDELAITLTSVPPLTSVTHDDERIGYEAAALLDHLMSGRRPPKQPVRIPPRGLVARASTDIVTADDPILRRAIAEIHSRLDQNFVVKQIAHHVAVSRSWLERLFRTHLQCSPHEFIARARVAKARELLAVKPPLRFREIARQCGFRDTRRLTLVFQSITGQSPRAFRAQTV
ncbi:MAG TPA: XylR family transcriptional regulator [Gemmataceae bacterium]|jgi:LacI family transcriptional regulator